MKIECHIHTKYSKDCVLKLETISRICKKHNILPVITDHNEIIGAVKYRKIYGDCIIGEEIATSEGEIVGLFLKEKIKPGLTPEETVKKIKQQGGLVYIPHPFDTLRFSTLKQSNLEIIHPDIMEIFNRRSPGVQGDVKAQEYALSNNILQLVGSDAHTKFDLAKTFNILPGFTSKDIDSPKVFMKCLKKVEHITSKKTPLFIHAYGKGIFILKRFKIL